MFLGFHPLRLTCKKPQSENSIAMKQSLASMQSCEAGATYRHRALELGLRPLPPAPLSKYSYYYEYTHVLGLPPPAAGPFQHASR